MTHETAGGSNGPMTMEELRSAAAVIAGELRAAVANSPGEPVPATGGGSRHRKLPEDLRQRFVDVRAELYQRGIYDPVLARFDSATVTQASTLALAEQLELISSSV